MDNRLAKTYFDLAKILHFRDCMKNLDFYVSALTEHNPLYSTEEVLSWLKGLNQTIHFNIEQVPLNHLQQWCFDETTGDLVHKSGKFFSVCGLLVTTNRGPVSQWSQPIIDQPEIGLLGIITKKIGGVLYFLMQAKAEPGNINTFQISPTVQATKSNYSGVHGGKKIPFLEYFLDNDRAVVLVDQLQSEQGARFFHKRNRNIIVRIPDDVELDMPSPYFKWLTLGQILKMMRTNDVVNMDTRSVVSNISYDPEVKSSLEPINNNHLNDVLHSAILSAPQQASALMVSAHSNSRPCLTSDEILHSISREKFKTDLSSRRIPLKDVKKWCTSGDEIYHHEHKYFTIIGLKVSADSREVTRWDQPIMQQKDPGLVGLIIKEIDGVLHFLVQLKLECGNKDLLELAPTVQCITGSYLSDKWPPFVNDIISHNPKIKIISDTMQSEEGGRFFRESNRNVIVIADDFNVEPGSDYLWMTLWQIKHFMKVNNFFNIEARSLISQLAMV